MDWLSGVRQQVQRLGVSRPERTKVPPIECCESRLVEPLYHREHCCIDEPDVGVCILGTELPDADEVCALEFLDAIGAARDVVKDGE